MANLKLVLLILLMALQLSGARPAAEASHGVDDSSHQYFHNVGQPHSHAEHDVEKFEINYSDNAVEHSNPSHDGTTVFVLDLPLITLPDRQQNSVIKPLDSSWEPPFLYQIPPPPKA
ncbi:hypothetical protein OCL06_12475 [Alteromonas sp. ASW11-19]|uniref:Cobalt transporter n=1 Tax=Alteromonas salexigens TaxID=2982530 RepID=A0ABT2VSJ5_9ALTE|nr:hypothetical protein [Alteromonas salexigens]MCU7555403.1 hypothetical protein [Alteromonas salexigens]